MKNFLNLNLLDDMITNRKFNILESQKKLLEKKFKVPVFIDIKIEKLYIIDEIGNKEIVF